MRPLLNLALAFGCVQFATGVQAAPAKPKALSDVDGRSFSLANSKSKATVLLFVAHDCPISNFYAPEISRLAADYSPRQVRFFVVYAEEELTSTEARKHAKSYGFRVPLVVDNTLQLSHSVGATVTPQAAVFAPDGKRLYLGRIDNRFLDYGKKRAKPSQRDLRVTLDAVLANKAVPHSTTTAVGCFIPEETPTK